MKRKSKALVIEGSRYPGFIPSFAEQNPGRPLPVKLSQEDLDKLKITIAGKDFYAFGNQIVCTGCGVPPNVLINRAPDEDFNFYLAMACTCQDPEPQPEPTPVEDPTPVEPTAS